MTAKEMFENIGYKLNKIKNDLVYSDGCNHIIFEKRQKSYVALHTFGGEHKRRPMTVNAEEHRAITQQMKELGWVE